MTLEFLFQLFGTTVVVCPAILLLLFATSTLLGRPLGERALSRLTEGSVLCGLFSAIIVLVLMLLYDYRHVPIELGHWVILDEEHFHFNLKFVFDRLSVPFVILTYVLCGTIGAFA